MRVLREPRQPATVSEYAGPTLSSAIRDVVVSVSPAGVLLRVWKPWWVAELAKSFFYLVGVLAVGVAILMALWGSRSGDFDPRASVCVMITAAVWGSFAAQLFLASRTLIRMLYGDPRVGTRFFVAADQEPGWRVDPVKAVELHREPMQVTLRRPHALRITTRRGQQFKLLRGGAAEELEAAATELRALLRLDAAPAKGFPIVPIEAKM